MAFSIRIYKLAERPMHTDEAVHGIKFGDLIENGNYKYDPHDYHGPTLNYITLIPAWIKSETTLLSLKETTLRTTTAAIGSAIVLLLLLFGTKNIRQEFLIAGVLIAFSPMLVFYSRYYIQEILLVFFNLGMIFTVYKYITRKKIIWAIIAGIFTGLMMATKETWIILVAIEAISLLITVAYYQSLKSIFNKAKELIFSWHFFLFLTAILFIYLTFYSSFFKYPQGIIDSVLAFKGYFMRAEGNVNHQHFWLYYFKILTKGSYGLLFFRADTWILLFGIIGAFRIIIFKNNDPLEIFFRFISISTLISAIAFSLIPYKTPWNFLWPYLGFVLLSAYQLHKLLRMKQKVIPAFIIVFIFIHIGYESYYDNFIYHSNPENPFVYSHPNQEIIEISQTAHHIFDKFNQQDTFFIEVIYPDHGYWPLPWYFRDIGNVGWFEKTDFEIPLAPLVITHLPNPELSEKMYVLPPPGSRNLYIPVFEKDKYLRPNESVNMLLRKDYWDQLNAIKTEGKDKNLN